MKHVALSISILVQCHGDGALTLHSVDGRMTPEFVGIITRLHHEERIQMRYFGKHTKLSSAYCKLAKAPASVPIKWMAIAAVLCTTTVLIFVSADTSY
jgi:hypothetical protein